MLVPVNIEHDHDLVLLQNGARELRVPIAWLREEVEAGRVPSLRAGRRLLIHLPTVRRLLVERAKALSACLGDEMEGEGRG